MLTIGNVVSPHETNATLKSVCPKDNVTTLQKRLDPFSISVVQECSAIKKGLLWEQQQNRFFFNRWKERYFILTSDYLTCFKKGSKKVVGMSEMGNFVYKINLNDIKNLNWVDKKKNGVIGVQLANTVIFLWNNADTVLDEWMAVLQDSTLRTKDRREAAIRKSATLLPNMISSSSSKIINATTDIIKRNESPNVILAKEMVAETPSENGFSDIIPPPPPPRRYLRCVSTDLGKMATSMDDAASKQIVLTPSLSRNSATTANSPNITKQAYRPNLEINNNGNNNRSTSIRKSSDASTASVSSHMSQSLRCKSSYSIQFSPLLMANNANSPTQLHQSHQRRITAKRLSAFHNSNHNHQIESNNQTYSSSFFQSADSEFTFVNSRATAFKPPSSPLSDNNNDRMVGRSYQPQHHSATVRNPNHPILNGVDRKGQRISSSASLMLNHRRKDNRFILETPPPVPPHRTHVHHF